MRHRSGGRLGTHVVETNGQALVARLKAIAGSTHVCLEEGTQSAWIYEILSPWAVQDVVRVLLEGGALALEGDGVSATAPGQPIQVAAPRKKHAGRARIVSWTDCFWKETRSRNDACGTRSGLSQA